MIQLIVLKNQEYLIAQIEEREESPECLLTNPYRVTDLTYWDYSNRKDKHIPRNDAALISVETEMELDNEGEEITVTETNYVLLEKFPKYTNQKQIYMRADDILTICDPLDLVVECYEKKLDDA